MAELNWMERYAATELVEMADSGAMSRREALGWLAKVCGSATAASAFLVACSSGGSRPSSAAKPAPTSSTTIGSTAATNGPAGHVLSVAEGDPQVRAASVEFAGPASKLFGYLARPATSGRLPGVIVIHEIFGLNDHIRDVARRLAKAGYVALAPDLVSRAGGTEASTNVIGDLTSGPVEDRIADLNAAAAYLETKRVYNGRLGVVGFCFGGGMTLSFAAAQPQVRAAVPYYGPTPEPAAQMADTKAAVLAHYGADDARVNASILGLEAALAGRTFTKRVWPGAGHQFNNDTSSAYREPTAVEAWNETLAWFATHLR